MTAATDASAAMTPDVETAIATDMVKRALPIAPAIVLVAAIAAGSNGAWTALLAVAIVIVNFLLAAVSLSWAARTSPVTLMAMSLGGFLVRMGLVTAVVLAVRHASWINLSVLAITILVTQLGLLFWETKYVGASLAFPGVKPK
ncbi:MAG TPA: ATP synthase subunit I [Acidimicrobiales bacterium]|nr:ATP synthase subunit I [Acidimicrobiales bacterium]